MGPLSNATAVAEGFREESLHEPTREELVAYAESRAHQSLSKKASLALLIILAATLVYSAAKFVFESATPLAWYGPVGVLALFQLIGLAWLRESRNPKQVEAVLVADVVIACVAAACAGIAAGRTTSVEFLLLGLSMLSSALVPWRPRTQAVVAVIAFLAIVGNAYGVTGGLFSTVGFPTLVPAMIILGASVYATSSMQTSRIEGARSDLLRERAEARTRELNATLERRVSERTAEMEQFTHIAAHDLREPARRVALLADMILESEQAVDPETRELLTRTRSEAERMLNVVSAFRALTGLSGGTMERKSTEMDSEVAAALTLFDDKIRGRGVEVVVEPIGMHAVYRELMLPLYRNLVGNALRHGPETGFRLRFSSTRLNGETVFSVGNTGSSVPFEKLESIFLPFVRLNSQDTAGNGLGLSICRRIVERHSGRIWAENADGEFLVRFTLGEATA